MAGASTPPSTIMNAPAKKLQRVNATAQFEAGRRLRWDVTWLHIPKNAGTELESVALRGGLRWGRHVAWMNPRLSNRTSHAHWPAAVCRPPFRHSNSCCGWWHLPPQMLQDLSVKPDWWPAHLRYHSATHVVCVLVTALERVNFNAAGALDWSRAIFAAEAPDQRGFSRQLPACEKTVQEGQN